MGIEVVEDRSFEPANSNVDPSGRATDLVDEPLAAVKEEPHDPDCCHRCHI